MNEIKTNEEEGCLLTNYAKLKEDFHKNLTLDFNERYSSVPDKKKTTAKRKCCVILAVIVLCLLLVLLVGVIVISDSAKPIRCDHLSFLVIDAVECQEAAKLSKKKYSRSNSSL